MNEAKSRKVYEDVVEQIKKILENGDLKPGDKLPSVRLLSRSFNVGQSTIREALSVLKTMGLIETKQGEGTFVRNFDPRILNKSIPDYHLIAKDDIIDLLDVRKMLERGAVALAAERRTKEDLIRIESALIQMELDLTRKRENFGEDADWRFHFAVVEASYNKILISLMKKLSATVRNSLKVSRQKLYETDGMPERLLMEHRSIFEMIKEQNIKKAEEFMVLHLSGVQEKLLIANEFSQTNQNINLFENN
ncbi:FadR/GntR family transcriptional regulator [Bacillus sp. FJAT-29814]|uniref:FadR/GntR family transcriptional regulator n=1 Tax=Bacillus sp. FJAT-29814 TaxID=1729688 RepID=UPI0020A55C71|nr:FadR/GntR family transcriptional regulator [Bacillus sp. FJAT-29814]